MSLDDTSTAGTLMFLFGVVFGAMAVIYRGIPVPMKVYLAGSVVLLYLGTLVKLVVWLIQLIMSED